MQVILQENIEKLGTRGQVVEVSPGYARNFLLPRKLAIEATPDNLKRLEKLRATLARKEATERESAARLAELLATVTVTLRRKAGESDHLFGSVTAADISEALAAQGYEVDKRKVRLEEPIKLIGEFTVPVRLHHDVETAVKVVVEREA